MSLKYRVIDRIENSLYLGSYESRRFVEELGIDVVISVMTSKEREKIVELPSHIKEYNIILEDSDDADIYDSVMYFTEIMRKSETEGHSVLVHCVAGMSRSPSLVIAYFMIRDFISFEVACARVKELRPAIEINDGFFAQLKKLSSLIGK